MKDAFEKLFRAVHQFKKLNVSDLIPGLSSSEFSVMEISHHGSIGHNHVAINRLEVSYLKVGC